MQDLQLFFPLARARHCFLERQCCCSSVMAVTLIKESRGDKSTPVATLAKPQTNMDLTLLLDFGHLHRVTLASVPAVCNPAYFSLASLLLYYLLTMSEAFSFFFCGMSCVTQGKHFLFRVHFVKEQSALLSSQFKWKNFRKKNMLKISFHGSHEK